MDISARAWKTLLKMHYITDLLHFSLQGTSSGTMACWDMRFQLPISSHSHPSRARIRRLLMHPLSQSWVIAGIVNLL